MKHLHRAQLQLLSPPPENGEVSGNLMLQIVVRTSETIRWTRELLDPLKPMNLRDRT